MPVFLPTPPVRKPRRKHRRVRTSWAGCGCPEGTKRVTVKVTKRNARGWSCSKNTDRGARYVRASCQGEQTHGDEAFRRPQAALLTHTGKASRADVEGMLVAQGKQKARGSKQKIDWTRCGCPDGSKPKKTKRGKRCQVAGRFVKAVCS
jgi:hypothetical protein